MPGEARDAGGRPVPLVDHHVHGVVTGDLGRDDVEVLISESGVAASGVASHFDAPVGLALRRWCPPVLGLEPHAAPDAYLARRAELGAEAVNRRFLAAAEVELLLVDTGHRTSEVATPAEMARLSGSDAFEVVRIEALAEALAQEVVGGGGDTAWWLDGVRGALERAAAGAAGFKTIVAYRHGFDLPVVRPPHRAVAGALDAWLTDLAPGQRLRLDAPVLVAEVLHQAIEVAAEHGLPLQVHAGLGDADLDLHRADPAVFTPWVRHAAERGVDVVLLHCYPYHRQAGYLAHVFPNVYFDVGCILNYAGPGARRVLAEALELAPFTKMLYSSDAFGLAELAYLGALQFRRHLGAILDGFVDAGECTRTDADRFARLVGAENARRIYPLARATRHSPGPGGPTRVPDPW
jgi:predicted TIM-barrel fold metal-dependent hydrolase